MCRVFANQPIASYEPETRSIRLGGHATSIRLERVFWKILDEIAARQSVTLPRFLNTLHDEVLEIHGACHNFASLLRCTCLKYASEIRDDDTAHRKLAASEVHDFSISEREQHQAPVVSAVGTF